MRTLGPVLLAGLLLVGAPDTARGGDPPPPPPDVPSVAWRLAPSAVAVYDRFAIRTANGVETATPTGSHPLTVRGHDLRDDGAYLPVTPSLDDLAEILALRVPTDPLAKTLACAFDPRDGATVAGTATLRAEADPGNPSRPGLLATWTFATKGPSGDGDRHEVRKGAAEVTLRWKDAGGGPPATSRVHLRWRRVPLVRDPKDPPRDVEETLELRLREVRTGRDDAFSKEVARAIDEGVAWLRTQQRPDGSFPPQGQWAVGTTALAVLTLAECDVEREDPALKRGLSWLAQQAPTKTYDRALALCAIERAYTPPSEEMLIASGRLTARVRRLPPDRRAWAERLAADLEASAVSPGSFGYPSAPNSTLPIDSSNTQYAALGLRAASRLSIPVKDTTWLGLARHFGVLRERHGPRGDVNLGREGERAPRPGETVAREREKARPVEVTGFLYSPSTSSWGSMTCAGIACLELARHELLRAKSPRLTPAFDAELEERIRSGWAWLDRHWGVDRHPEHPSNSWTLYYLYALERAAVFSRVRTVGGKDWYFEGATELLLRRAKAGTWSEAGLDDLVNTCFGVLFLKKATPPLTDDGSK